MNYIKNSLGKILIDTSNSGRKKNSVDAKKCFAPYIDKGEGNHL